MFSLKNARALFPILLISGVVLSTSCKKQVLSKTKDDGQEVNIKARREAIARWSRADLANVASAVGFEYTGGCDGAKPDGDMKYTENSVKGLDEKGPNRTDATAWEPNFYDSPACPGKDGGNDRLRIEYYWWTSVINAKVEADKLSKQSLEPEKVDSVHYGYASQEYEATVTNTYKAANTVTKNTSFKFTESLGIETEIDVGIPLISESKTKFKFDVSAEQGVDKGTLDSKEDTTTINQTFKIPADSCLDVDVVRSRQESSVPFSMDIVIDASVALWGHYNPSKNFNLEHPKNRKPGQLIDLGAQNKSNFWQALENLGAQNSNKLDVNALMADGDAGGKIRAAKDNFLRMKDDPAQGQTIHVSGTITGIKGTGWTTNPRFSKKGEPGCGPK